MKRALPVLFFAVALVACATTYKARPVPFKLPAAYTNATRVAGAVVGARAYVDPKAASEAFGFDIRGAGMLPVEVVFDNQGPHKLEIQGSQTFLVDKDGNLWSILPSKVAYERATRYSRTKQMVKKGAYSGLLGATAGTIVGAAVGVVTGEDVGLSAGKGAAMGAAVGATLGGAQGYASGEARRLIIDDLRRKSLQNKDIAPKSLAHGFLFFPGEALSARELRLQLREVDTGKVHQLKLSL